MKMHLSFMAVLIVAALAAGCASNGGQHAAGNTADTGARQNFTASDGRKITIGNATPVNGGRSFRNPHLEQSWVADGFNFTGYDTLYIAPTTSTAKFNEDEIRPHALAVERVASEYARSLQNSGLFANVVTKESDIKPGARVLRLENAITEYRKGGGGARYWAGAYGAGQPIIRVKGTMKDGARDVFTYEARRSGVSASARMIGGFKSDEDIQMRDIQSMVLDVTDFMAALAGKYTSR